MSDRRTAMTAEESEGDFPSTGEIIWHSGDDTSMFIFDSSCVTVTDNGLLINVAGNKRTDINMKLKISCSNYLNVEMKYDNYAPTTNNALYFRLSALTYYGDKENMFTGIPYNGGFYWHSIDSTVTWSSFKNSWIKLHNNISNANCQIILPSNTYTKPIILESTPFKVNSERNMIQFGSQTSGQSISCKITDLKISWG